MYMSKLPDEVGVWPLKQRMKLKHILYTMSKKILDMKISCDNVTSMRVCAE